MRDAPSPTTIPPRIDPTAPDAAPPASPNDKLRPSNAPVDVPRTPPLPDAHTPDEANAAGGPRINPDRGASWADTTRPAPDKVTVRKHL